MALSSGLLGLYMAEDDNMLERSVLKDAELDGVLSEAAELDASIPEQLQQQRHVAAKINNPLCSFSGWK